jgi:RNA polymerase-binding transcription factor DksA
MPLTPLELEHIAKRLHEERDRIVGQLNEFTTLEASEDGEARAGDNSKFPTHPADLGSDTQDEELDASIATRRSGEIAEIDAALERIRTSPDSFGVDENTGEPIPYARLQIIPWARTNVG